MMIHIFKFPVAIIVLLTASLVTMGQQSFSPEAYMRFLDQHQDYKASQLLADHPFKTTYYSGRQYPAELSEVPWFDSLNSQFHFTPDEKEFLKQNFFMVSERLEAYDWASAFIGLYSSDLPLFLSSDFLLSTLHSSYDAILQTIEWQFLEPNLKELLHAMYDQFPALVDKYSGDERFMNVLKDVDLYISVALSLAEGKAFPPQFDTMLKFNDVMAAVEAEELTTMTLFTATRARKLDFSQFTPRGHYTEDIYTRDEVFTLENYFKAMMWLGRIDFLMTAPPQNPWELKWSDEELRRMQLGALLTNEVLFSCGKSENLVRHEKIISFMVGPDDNMTPEELKRISNLLLTTSHDLFQEETFDRFMDSLNASDDFGQKIMSNYFYVDPYSADPGNLPVSYKLLGQKFLIDSYVFSEVVYDRIIFDGKKVWRPMPDPLDVLASLGNEDALALLEGELEQYKYAANMAGLKYLIDAYDGDFWKQSLYNTWLGSIRSLNPPETSNGLPYFMQTTAWHHKSLNTQLTSWAQLRHDNILYAKQSYTGGTSCSYPYTYVEPCPQLYEGLKLFSENASDFFSKVFSGEMLESKEKIIEFYTGYGEIMGMLEGIATKELQGTSISDDEITFMKTMINGFMASGPSITGWYNDLFYDPYKGLSWDFTVADVHTQPTDLGGAEVGHVLHVGNGMINMGVFLVKNPCNPGQYMAFAGPVSSFHQEVTSNFKRLNNQEWEEFYRSGYDSYPSRPDWVATYLLDYEGKAYPEGRTLKGTLYTGTSIMPGKETRAFDYLLVFPNPAAEEAHVRFVLNEKTDFSMVIYDASGRTVFTGENQVLFPAEHDLPIPLKDWQPGMYMIQIRIGQKQVSKELMVQ